MWVCVCIRARACVYVCKDIHHRCCFEGVEILDSQEEREREKEKERESARACVQICTKACTDM